MYNIKIHHYACTPEVYSRYCRINSSEGELWRRALKESSEGELWRRALKESSEGELWRKALKESSEGTSSEGTSSEGTSSEGTSSEGTSSEGTSSEGTSSEGTSSEGTSSAPKVTFENPAAFAFSGVSSNTANCTVTPDERGFNKNWSALNDTRGTNAGPGVLVSGVRRY